MKKFSLSLLTFISCSPPRNPPRPTPFTNSVRIRGRRVNCGNNSARCKLGRFLSDYTITWLNARMRVLTNIKTRVARYCPRPGSLEKSPPEFRTAKLILFTGDTRNFREFIRAYCGTRCVAIIRSEITRYTRVFALLVSFHWQR